MPAIDRPLSDCRYCTYQQPAVRLWFICFMCFFPGLCGMLAAWAINGFPLLRASHKEVVAGIAAHKEGKEATDPLTNMNVPVVEVDPGKKAAAAAYDHYSDAELTAAAAMSDAAGAVGVLKSMVTKRIGVTVFVLTLLLALTFGVAGSDTTPDQLYLSITITLCSLSSSLLLFMVAFDMMRCVSVLKMMNFAV